MVYLLLFLICHTQVEEYIALSRRDIHIELNFNEINTIHALLIKYQDHIVRELLMVFNHSFTPTLHRFKPSQMPCWTS